MTLKIYRLREYPGGFVMDDTPEAVYENITEYIDAGRVVYFKTGEKQNTRRKDAWNYRFILE